MFDAWDGKYSHFFLPLKQRFLQTKMTNLKLALCLLFFRGSTIYKQYSTGHCAIMTLKPVSLPAMKLSTYQAIYVEKE